jgi:predicted membrane protein
VKLKTGLFLISLVFLFGQLYGIYQMHYYLSEMGEVMTSLPDLFWFYDASFTAWFVFFCFCFMFYLVFSILFNCIPKWDKSKKSQLERLFG